MNMLQPAQIRYCCAVFFLFVCLVIYRCSGRFFCALIAFLGSIIQLLWLPEHWVQEKSNHMSFAANFLLTLLYFIFFIIWKDSGEFKLGLSGIFMCVHNLHLHSLPNDISDVERCGWETWQGRGLLLISKVITLTQGDVTLKSWVADGKETFSD